MLQAGLSFRHVKTRRAVQVVNTHIRLVGMVCVLTF